MEIRVDNIQPEKFIQVFHHYDEMLPRYYEGVKVTKLPEEHGFKMVH